MGTPSLRPSCGDESVRSLECKTPSVMGEVLVGTPEAPVWTEVHDLDAMVRA